MQHSVPQYEKLCKNHIHPQMYLLEFHYLIDKVQTMSTSKGRNDLRVKSSSFVYESAQLSTWKEVSISWYLSVV